MISSGTVPAQSTFIGCAGWSIPASHAQSFTDSGSHLERYAGRFGAVEINSSFYRPHRPQTYARWAASVPEDFRFAVKMPRSITHDKRLHDVTAEVERFVSEVAHLGPKLGPLLVQLPPSLAFDHGVAGAFWTLLRERFDGQIVCEPRHASWFTPDAAELLTTFQIAQVAADPAPVPQAAAPGGWSGLFYYRLHGSPQMYYSEYAQDYLQALTSKLQETLSTPTWCIFDNTAAGAATKNALDVMERLSS